MTTESANLSPALPQTFSTQSTHLRRRLNEEQTDNGHNFLRPRGRLNPRKKADLRSRIVCWWVAPPHQCVTTMKSVSFPVSWLNPLSEIINEEAGVSSSEILSTVSRGISMRSRAALALSGDGTGAVCRAGASRSFVPPSDVRGNSSGIDTTVQRMAAPSFRDSIAVNTCVPSGSPGFSIVTGTSNNGVKPWRTKSLLNLRLTKMEIGMTF